MFQFKVGGNEEKISYADSFQMALWVQRHTEWFNMKLFSAFSLLCKKLCKNFRNKLQKLKLLLSQNILDLSTATKVSGIFLALNNIYAIFIFENISTDKNHLVQIDKCSYHIHSTCLK